MQRGDGSGSGSSQRGAALTCRAERREYYDFKDMPPLPLTVSRIHVPSLDYTVVDRASQQQRQASLAIFYDIFKDDQYAAKLTRRSAITALCMYDRCVGQVALVTTPCTHGWPQGCPREGVPGAQRSAAAPLRPHAAAATTTHTQGRRVGRARGPGHVSKHRPAAPRVQRGAGARLCGGGGGRQPWRWRRRCCTELS